ncbi:MAG: protein phosphatase 2C domain-containing protein [Alphaproteobacteria bacterium]|nr:protein phosphatase 2C domain-containing protein [Alphaproteobacteria bacterium]
MRIAAGNAQDIGARDSQEDAFGFSSLDAEAQERLGGVCMVLCDGMGGLAKGGEASRAAVTAALAEFERRHPSDPPAETLRRMLEGAQRAVRDVSSNAGTTLVACIVADRRLYWVSVGDSRVYLCRSFAKPQQLTVDDTVGTSRMRSGGALEGIDQDVNLEALTAYVGAPEPPAPQIKADGLRLRPGDRIVASSDGLHRGLDIKQLDRFASAGRPMASARKMLQAVLDQHNPTQDNATVAILAMKQALPLGLMFGGKLGSALLGSLATLLIVLIVAWAHVSHLGGGSAPVLQDKLARHKADPNGKGTPAATGPVVPVPPVPPAHKAGQKPDASRVGKGAEVSHSGKGTGHPPAVQLKPSARK